MKKEALELADYLDNNVEAMLMTEQKHIDKASVLLRKLVKEIDRFHMTWYMAENEVSELKAMVATLDQENRQLHARNERLEKELKEMAMDNLVAFQQELEGRNH